MFILPVQRIRFTPSRPEEAAISQPESYTARCTATLERALNDVPFYRDWNAVDPGPTVPVRERLAALPVLTKRNLRAHVPRGFMDEKSACGGGFASGDVEIVTTSGTAEDRVSVVWHQPLVGQVGAGGGAAAPCTGPRIQRSPPGGCAHHAALRGKPLPRGGCPDEGAHPR